jgi:hypothetical protein
MKKLIYDIGDLVKIKQTFYTNKNAIGIILEKQVILEEETMYVISIAGIEGKTFTIGHSSIIEKI